MDIKSRDNFSCFICFFIRQLLFIWQYPRCGECFCLSLFSVDRKQHVPGHSYYYEYFIEIFMCFKILFCELIGIKTLLQSYLSSLFYLIPGRILVLNIGDKKCLLVCLSLKMHILKKMFSPSRTFIFPLKTYLLIIVKSIALNNCPQKRRNFKVHS